MTRRLRLFLVMALALPFATGAGLLTYLAARWSIHLTIALMAVSGLIGAALLWSHLDPSRRPMLLKRVRIGMTAGLLATGAYDLTRFIIVKVFHYTFWPFDIFSIFGKLLVGTAAPRWLILTSGIGFHVCNGIGFGLAYTLFFRRPRIWNGLLWAGVLEILMISYYPGWLHLKAIDELLSVSVLGHTAFGLVLGMIGRRFVNDQSVGIV